MMPANGAALEALRNRRAAIQPVSVDVYRRQHLNMVVASLTMGGAERLVLDVARALDGRIASGTLFVLGRTVTSHEPPPLKDFRIVHVHGRDRRDKIGRVALEVLSSPNPVVITHLVRSAELAHLWEFGVATIPVVHNSWQGWHEPPEVFEHDLVPAVAAVCRSVADQLRDAGLSKPITILRHELGVREGFGFDTANRERVRNQHGVAADALLIGMVGQFKAHKAYVRAVRVLAALRGDGPVKLMILGGWDHDYGAGRAAYAATLDQAARLGVAKDLLCLGPVADIGAYYSAFDVFLNTSVYEGMSIATLEAVRSGCPTVTADVGGQHEAIGPDDALVHDPADVGAYLEAIKTVSRQPRRKPALAGNPDVFAHLWAWIAEYGRLPAGRIDALADVLFVTSNLNPGGAQRSLVNLLEALRQKPRSWLCVLDQVMGDSFIAQVQAAGVPCVGLNEARNMPSRVDGVLELARRLGVRTVCFWNTDPVCKLLLAKVLEHARIRLVDVSPGPMMFEELDATGELQRRIAFSRDDYVRRLDVLVAKYQGGLPTVDAAPRQSAIIPNGVPRRRERRADTRLLPPDADPRFAIVSCCRLAPSKRLECLVEMMAVLAKTLPAANLTIVGGVDPRHAAYVESVQADIVRRGLANIRFVGPHADTLVFLPAFRIFVMVSRDQGCPNASLEAMASGLPVVANGDGGTAEQVLHGVTGLLADADDNGSQLARWVSRLLRDSDEALRLGEAARAHVRTNFSMEKMVTRYREVL